MDFLIRAAAERDLEALSRIYNDEVLHRTATWDLEPWPIEQRRAWFAEHEGDATQPVLVADSGGECVGFAYLSIYRSRVGYRFTRESTVYVDTSAHRRGIGRALLGALIEAASAQPVHALIAVIEASNIASVELHRALGYVEGGRRLQVGHKFGRWLDSVEMELLLDFEP